MTKAYDREKGMYHTLVDGAPRIEGLLEDQVFIIAALLDAYEITGKHLYFDRALELMDITVRRFWDEKDGGFFDTAQDLADRHGSLTTQRKPFQDSPTPAGNAVAVLVLDRLDALAEREDFGEKAEATLTLFAPKAEQYGLFAATYGLALLHHLRAPVDVVVVGPAGDDRTRSLLRAAYDAPRAANAFSPSTPALCKPATCRPVLPLRCRSCRSMVSPWPWCAKAPPASRRCKPLRPSANSSRANRIEDVRTELGWGRLTA